MPLSTIFVSTVNTRPRTWSSHTNLRSKDVVKLEAMNSAEEIHIYRDPITLNSYCSATRRPAGHSYDVMEKANKKDKKWSLGSFFRKKKKDETSSEEEDKKGMFTKRRRKNDKKKKLVGTFDHVVIPQTNRNSTIHTNGYHDEPVIDPMAAFNNYFGRTLPAIPKDVLTGRQTADSCSSRVSSTLDSIDSLNKQRRKGLAKARAEARRTSLNQHSSSDDDSQRSNSSQRFRSDESLSKNSKDASGRRSRNSRTERHFKRLSRDGENPFNYLRLSRSDADSFLRLSDESNRSASRSPLVPANQLSYTSLSSQSGLSTIPPSHINSRFHVSNSTSNPSYKPPLSLNDYNNAKNKNLAVPTYANINLRSVSCDNNIHKSPSDQSISIRIPIITPESNQRYRNLSLIDTSGVRNPPAPPPRDPRRVFSTQNIGNVSPTSNNSNERTGYSNKCFETPPNNILNNRCSSFKAYPTYRSTSEDHINRNYYCNKLNRTAPEMGYEPPVKINAEKYQYLTDKQPRSRKPIFIQKSLEQLNKKENKPVLHQHRASVKYDKESDDFLEKLKARKSLTNSPKMFTSRTHVENKIFLPSVLQPEKNNNEFPVIPRTFKPVTPTKVENIKNNNNADPVETGRKSTNLEDALNELEAIYNSLRLGDEDLLERAEKREQDAAAEKLLKYNQDHFITNIARGALSDSAFDTVDSPRKKRVIKKVRHSDRTEDDMAFRKLNKGRNTLTEPQNAIAKVSYLLASPLYASEQTEENEKDEKEPDITLDDVVYRNIKYANQTLKVSEPQPFGIPIGPITPAANSDYLHAVPDNTQHAISTTNKIPDIVKDDLAFRNLRKDNNKEPALPPLSAEDLKNNNLFETKIDTSSNLNLKKNKRAVRSLSANIGSLICQEVIDKAKKSNRNKTLTDIADAMEMARQVLKDKECKITETRKASMSDTDAMSFNYPTRTDRHAKSRSSFLNDMKNSTYLDIRDLKPPHGLTPERKMSRSKESTPIPTSMFEDTQQCSQSNSFEDVLAAIAKETKETSDRITQELAEISAEREKRNSIQSLEETAEALRKLGAEDVPKNIEERVKEVNRKYSDIDAVSQHAKLCEKLLESVVGKDDELTEEVKKIEEPEIIESVANIVLTTSNENTLKKKTKLELEPDYENLVSDKELTLEELTLVTKEPEKAEKSIFESKKDEIIAEFKQLEIKETNPDKKASSSSYSSSDSLEDYNENVDKSGPKNSKPKQRRTKLSTKWHPKICSTPDIKMSTNLTRSERIARYKEERRKQLAAQFDSPSRVTPKDCSSGSSSEGFRSTKTSRLRAAAIVSQDSYSSSQQPVISGTPVNERITSAKINEDKLTNSGKVKVRDKSGKRKSNLNRALTCEDVPTPESEDLKNRRRNRRFFPPEVLEQSTANDDRNKPISNNTASSSICSSPNNTAVLNSSYTPRKSELSIHMENARKGITPSCSEMGKHRSSLQKTPATPSSSDAKHNGLKHSTGAKSRLESSARSRSDTESIRTKLFDKENKENNTRSDNDEAKHISKRMQELTALTKETLARVERLACKSKDMPNRRSSLTNTKSKQCVQIASPKLNQSTDRSILKKKAEENIIPTTHKPSTSNHNVLPVSILKRKVSQDDKTESNPTPPVTFSPNVVEPTPTNRRLGILKKRRSLDESQVMRHRSCSPDVANKSDYSRSILKSQRRSSLEDLPRLESPETQLQGILKRKTHRSDDSNHDHSLDSPQGILKRKSGASSAGSNSGLSNTCNTPHVSITTAVILAAARGAEMVLNNQTSSGDSVRPILKKKSLEDYQTSFDFYSDTPKPILKKKSSVDIDDLEYDKPQMRPILKSSRSSLDRDVDQFERSISESEEHKPILRQGTSRLSFCEEGEVVLRRPSNSRRSLTICTDYVESNSLESKNEDRTLRRPRPLSVSELVSSFEKSTPPVISTGAIPKRASFNRYSDRYMTQPVTSNELEASLSYVTLSPRDDHHSSLSSSVHPVDTSHSSPSLLDCSPLDNDSNLNSFLTSSLRLTSPDSSMCAKMSSDSAFQSLGDGLELEQEEEQKPQENVRKSLENQMRNIAEKAKKFKLNKGNAGIEKYRNRPKDGSTSDRVSTSSRFSTQPITFDEVQEASKIKKETKESPAKEEEPSLLSLSQRIQLFNLKVSEDNQSPTPQKKDPRRRLARFSTQPVTPHELHIARRIWPASHALDEEKSSDKKGILKSTNEHDSQTRSSLRKRDYISPAKITIDEPQDTPCDEGISCDDGSGSDFEGPSAPLSPNSYLSSVRSSMRSSLGRSASARCATRPYVGKNSSGEGTSDGESSGGQEIRKIMGVGDKLKFKDALENVLGKKPLAPGHESKSSGLRRSNTTSSGMPRSIAELQATLQRKGDSEWRKRIKKDADEDVSFLKERNRYNDELSEKSLLASRKDDLGVAAKQWKSRVEKSDAEKFSVVGKKKDALKVAINIPVTDAAKRTPRAKKFKGKDGDSSSAPSSPELKITQNLSRSKSVPEQTIIVDNHVDAAVTSKRHVEVSRPDDFTFKNFYKQIDEKTSQTTHHIELSLDDLDAIPRQQLLVQKKNVQVQKRRVATKNPVKALASREDIKMEYTEILTGVAEREQKRLNIEKLAKNNSNLAVEALAGLASKEDFKAIPLKKSTTTIGGLYPFKNVMLLHVKGRRHVQTRLVNPVAESINEGDNFILVTPKTLYHYTGAYSNVIEQSRTSDVVSHIQQTGDLGCKVDKVINVSAKVHTKETLDFWKLLGETNECTNLTDAGNPNEDELYESNILATNMIYGLEHNELVPLDNFWGGVPKYEMLKPTSVYVFDFGSEMYVWSGKNASQSDKQCALRLAKELWEEGYNYSECNVCPLNVASILGDRHQKTLPLKSEKRPDWALFAKLTQHRETILFKEKFLDWPDFSRVIRVKDDKTDKIVDASYDIKPCDISHILKPNTSEPDIVIENTHLGRGDQYFDEETRRLFTFDTLEITMWHILENTYEKLDEQSIGQFYDGDSYIIRWRFRMTVKGRELSGKPSKHAQSGRDRSVFFCWQGANATINEKGSAALLTIELDSENAPQLRIVQGGEPAAFLKLFGGNMVVHHGKRDQVKKGAKLFIVKGEVNDEICMTEVKCNIKQLRSRTSFVLFNAKANQVTIWHGAKSGEQTRNATKGSLDKITSKNFKEFLFDNDLSLAEMKVLNEGKEDRDFFKAVGSDVKSYVSLLKSDKSFDYTMRMFHFSGVAGSFNVTEMLSPHRSEHCTPFPFLQSDLYSASQPALFLIDNKEDLWLWQGWWPEREEEAELSDQTGSGAVRWQVERRAAMQTAINYWNKKHTSDIKAHLVWAGLEPAEFINLFPSWEVREDVAELNQKEGKKPNEVRDLVKELALLSRTSFPLAELLQRPLPEGVDPTHLEIYLSPDDFQQVLSMSKEEFQKLPTWKQTSLKKEKGLF